MRVEFTHLEIENFKSFTGLHKLALRDFDYGLNFVRGKNEVEPRLGSNGAGKSSIWDALTWCLYGKTVGGLRNPDVRPWAGKGSTFVQVGLFVDGKHHVIGRSISPNALHLNRKTCGPEDIEDLVGMDFDLFVNTVLLGQGQPLFYDLQPRDKMQLFVNALQLDRWDSRSEQASLNVKELESIVQSGQGEREGLQTALYEIELLRETEQHKAASWERDIEALLKESRGREKKLRDEAEAHAKKKDKADLALDGAEAELRALEKQSAKEQDRILEIERAHARAEAALASMDGDLKDLREDMKALGAGDTCPTCGQSLKGTSLAKHKRNLHAKIDQLQTRISNCTPLETGPMLEKAVEKGNQTRKHLDEFTAKSNDARDSYDFNNKRYQQLKAEADALKQVNRSREAEVNPHTGILRSLKKRKQSVEDKVGTLEHELMITERKVARVKFWIKGFKDVRLYVLEEVLQELELVTNGMLEEAGLIGWSVQYLIEKETKSGSVSRGLAIMIKSPRSAGPVRWESWSGGEGQRLRVVGALALSEVLLQQAGVKPDLEVLDEPTQHLSQQGVNDLCEYLSDRAKRLKKAIWYCDHQSIESTRFSSVVTIVRDRKGSRIEL